MNRIQSGITDQYVYFSAPPGLGTWVVNGSRNGAAAAAFTTPTVAELSLAVMPGCYSLLLDEQTTMTAGNTTEILKLYISAAGWVGKSIEVELFDPLAGFLQQMTESYAADGTAPTPAQALFLIQQLLSEFAISSTTMTVKKLDGSTTAATLTLDDDSNPTSITRTT